MPAIDEIRPGGGDTGAPLNMQKRTALLRAFIGLLQGVKFLDGGCGTGNYLLELLRVGADAQGVEYDGGKVEQFRQACPEYAQRISQGDLEKLPQFKDATFDAVLLNEVLEHVPDEKPALREMRRVLKPGGKLFIFSPNRLYPFETHGVYWGKSEKKVPHYFPFIPYIPVPLGKLFLRYWARNYWPWELRALVRGQGFRIVHAGFVWQTFENISGKQPWLLRVLKPVLRRISSGLEGVPVLRNCGVSQFIVAEKAE